MIKQAKKKGAKMAYKKPQIVAKSAARQTFVAGCPANKVHNNGCMDPSRGGGRDNLNCNTGIPR